MLSTPSHPTRTLYVNGHSLVASALNPHQPGQPTILLHRITASIAAWSAQEAAPWLATGPCFSLSLPGHFPARFPVGFDEHDIDAEMIADTLSAGIRALVGDTPVTLVGHSTGGFAALAVAATAPQQVQRVVSVSGFARGQWTGVLGWNQRTVRAGRIGQGLFRALYDLCRQTRRIFKASLRIYVYDTARFYAYPGLDDYLTRCLPNYRGLDLHAMAHYFARMPELDISSWLPRISVPMLLVTGANDPTVPATESVRIARRMPRATLRTLPECGHLPALEQPAALEAVVRPWLAATSDAKGTGNSAAC
jgi:pimeloyl-ACP methyl ester carboxylesterase